MFRAAKPVSMPNIVASSEEDKLSPSEHCLGQPQQASKADGVVCQDNRLGQPKNGATLLTDQRSQDVTHGNDRPSDSGTGAAQGIMTSGPEDGRQEAAGQTVQPDELLGELNDVDLAEQRRILHDLWLHRTASLTKTAVKRPAVGGGKVANKRTKPFSLAKGKQSQLSNIVTKPKGG